MQTEKNENYRRPMLQYVPNQTETAAGELAKLSDEELLDVLRRSDEILLSRRYQMNPNIVLRQVGDECIVVPTGDMAQLSNAMISLNEFSAYLLRRFEQPASMRQALDDVAAQYDGFDAYRQREAINLMAAWTQLQLLQPEPPK